MSYNVDEYRKVYDETYTNIKDYNFHNILKDTYVDLYAAHINGKLLDAGCGEGIHLKRLLKEGYDVFGIELSGVCCKKYLKNVPHQNIDIEKFSKQNKKFDGIICMDVLEHIPLKNIKDTLSALKNMSSSIFLGIANHSDKLNGKELHLIQEDNDWWDTILKEYYRNVYFITEQFNGRFYYFYCNNIDVDEKNYLNLNKSFSSIINMENEKDTLIEANRQLNLELKSMNAKYEFLQKKYTEITNSLLYKITKYIVSK